MIDKKYKADKSHPLYNEYLSKCLEYGEEYRKEYDKQEAIFNKKYPNYNGLDGEMVQIERQLRHELYKKVDALAEQYKEIFTIERTD